MTDDLDQLMAVMEAAFDPYWREAWTRRQVADSLIMPTTYALLAGADGGPLAEGDHAVGFVLARYAPGEVELLLVGVHPDFRGRGVARRLVARFEDCARDMGAEHAFLEMRADNPARFLYDKIGFEPIGRRKAYYTTLDGKRIDAITFGKSLA